MDDTVVQFTDVLSALTVSRRALTECELGAALEAMVTGQWTDAETAAVLVGLRMKGETSQEIAAAARVLRRHMVSWEPGRAVLDTCGTGGDGSGTFNISTATALVAAGAGVPVVKHGNRSVSSKSGSADVLAALGVRIDGDAEAARQSLDRTGLAFCFAPNFHPALKNVGPVRRKLGVPTIFNCLGPLANPAGARKQLLGVGRVDLLDRMAEALAELGTDHALIVCSRDGLDEVSLSAPTLVREIRGAAIHAFEWTPADFGLEPCSLSDLQAVDAAASSRMIETVLANQEGPALRIVLANAAAALLAADRVDSLRAGVAMARDAVQQGKALAVLEELRKYSARGQD